jgi:hypothetical protein
LERSLPQRTEGGYHLVYHPGQQVSHASEREGGLGLNRTMLEDADAARARPLHTSLPHGRLPDPSLTFEHEQLRSGGQLLKELLDGAGLAHASAEFTGHGPGSFSPYPVFKVQRFPAFQRDALLVGLPP